MSQRNRQMDGLRGYAAVAVAIYHTVLGVELSQIERILPVRFFDLSDDYSRAAKIVLALANGENAVIIFFVLSGAVLFKSLMVRGGQEAAIAAPFFVRRVFRILPALITSLIACALVWPLFDRPVPLQDFLTNAALLGPVVNGATWTLSVEMLAAPLILGSYYFYRRGLWYLVAFLAATFLTTKANAIGQLFMSLRGFWLCFALGILIPTRLGETFARILPRYSWLVFLAAMIIAQSVLSSGNAQRVCAALFVASVYHGRTGALGPFLETPLSAFLGRISYSFYLFNVLFLEIICSHLRSVPFVATHPLEVGLIASIAVVAISLPVAYASALFVEEPFIRFSNRLMKAHPPKVAVQELA